MKKEDLFYSPEKENQPPKSKVLFYIFMYVIIWIGLLIGGFAYADSLTVSPISATYHGKADEFAKLKFNNNFLEKSTTVHFGLGLTYKTTHMQYTGWYFKDSFNNHAGGFGLGPKIDFWEYFNVGWIVGAYIRELPPAGIDSYPVSSTIGGVELSPIALVTTGVEVPATEIIDITLDVKTNVILTNTSIGIKFNF